MWNLTETVRAHRPADASEAASVARLLAFLPRVAEPSSRRTLEGHVTASAMVLDREGRALLLFHGTLGIWVQPGGHVEEGDADVAATALREATEESGLTDLVLERVDGRPLVLDIDVHPIPESRKKAEPAHWHYDLCFLARTQTAHATRIDPHESHAFRWVAASELESLQVDGATRRRLRKAFERTP